jgi:hypothetical protein
MPRNALTPSSVNALLRETADYPEYGQLVDYLTERRMLPSMVTAYLSPETTGEFATPGFFDASTPRTGVVKLSRRAMPSTVVHELTHATQRQMGWQYSDLKQKAKKQDLTSKEQQFVDAYEKLIYNFGKQYTQPLTAQKIAPDWAKSKEGYRASGGELAAFGMGSTVSPNTNPAPLHIDPSYATEFSILLDLARQVQKAQPVAYKR